MVSVNERALPIDLLKGNVLLGIAQSHRRASQVVLELVQNALDEDPKHVFIIISEERKTISVYDDGNGVSEQDMVENWLNVGKSRKRGQKDKIGERAFAKVAPLLIGDGFTLTSRPMGIPKSHYFSTTVLRKEFEDNPKPEVHLKQHEIGFSYGDVVSFKPTTLAKISGVSKGALRELLRMDALAEEIADTFGSKIQRSGVNIQILSRPAGVGNRKDEKRAEVRPREFPGTRQKEFSIPTKFGPVTFEMYTTRQAIRGAKVLVDHAGRHEFLLANMTELWRRVKDCLGSGHFHGKIHVNFCTILPERQGFELNEQYDAFVEAVETFVDDVARPYIEELRLENKFEKYNALFASALDRLDEFFKKFPELKLRGAMPRFIKQAADEATLLGGNQRGDDRKAPDIHEVLERHKARREQKRHPKPSGGKEGHSSGSRTPAPLPPGRIQKKVKGQCGIEVTYGTPTSETGFKKRTWWDAGTIVFNIEHPDWSMYDNAGEKPLTSYIQLHLIKELTVVSTDFQNCRQHFLELFEDVYMPFMAMFIVND